jgi:hypothetical protein
MSIDYLISYILGIISRIRILEMQGCCLAFHFLSKVCQLLSKWISKLRIRVWPLGFRFDRMYWHNSKAAFIEPCLFFHLLLNSFCVILINVHVFYLFFLLRLMTIVFLLIFQWLLPNQINSRYQVVSSYIYKKIRLEGYIFLRSTL